MKLFQDGGSATSTGCNGWTTQQRESTKARVRSQKRRQRYDWPDYRNSQASRLQTSRGCHRSRIASRLLLYSPLWTSPARLPACIGSFRSWTTSLRFPRVRITSPSNMANLRTANDVEAQVEAHGRFVLASKGLPTSRSQSTSPGSSDILSTFRKNSHKIILYLILFLSVMHKYIFKLQFVCVCFNLHT